MAQESSGWAEKRTIHEGNPIRRVRLDGVDRIQFERSDEVRVEIRSETDAGLEQMTVVVENGTLRLTYPEKAAVELPPGVMIDRVGSMVIGPTGITMDGVQIKQGERGIKGTNIGLVVGGDLVVHGNQTFDVAGGTVRITTTGRVERRDTVAGFTPGPDCVVVICQPECPEMTLSSASAALLQGVQQDELDITLSGASRVEAQGAVSKLYIDASGAASASLGALDAKDIKLHASGSAQVTVAPREAVRGDASGVARVTINGSPAHRDIEVSGLAKVLKG